eukprot:306489-Pyramimonas_sp.AAC.1
MTDEAPDNIRRKGQRQIRRLQQRASIWAPFDRRLTLRGIRLPSQEIATQPWDMSREIRGRWGPVFGQKQVLEAS